MSVRPPRKHKRTPSQIAELDDLLAQLEGEGASIAQHGVDRDRYSDSDMSFRRASFSGPGRSFSEATSATTPPAPTMSPSPSSSPGVSPIFAVPRGHPTPPGKRPATPAPRTTFKGFTSPLSLPSDRTGQVHFSPSRYSGSPSQRNSPKVPVPGLTAQQGTPSVGSGSGNIPPPSAAPPSDASRAPDPAYDKRVQSGYGDLVNWTAEDEKYLRKKAISRVFKEKYAAQQNLANPITTPPGDVAPPSLSTTPPSGLPPAAVGEGQGGGAPPAAPAGAPGAGEGDVEMAGAENRSSGMQGTHAYPSGTEGMFRIPNNTAPANSIGGPGGGNEIGGGGGGGGAPPRDVGTRRGEGDYVPPPYGDGSAFAEKSREGDSDRLDPITPASGSKQTPETANSLVSATKLEESAKKQSPEKVLGDAEERANMGKGAFSGYEFAGPYDYPTFPSGRRDTSLTSLGAWRSKTGQHSASLWSSKLTARGQPAKREKFFKWSTKGGGNWKKLNSNDAMRVMTKNSARKNGARWMAQPNPGDRLTDMMSSTLKRKMGDIDLGKMGNERANKRKKGQDPTGNFQVQM